MPDAPITPDPPVTKRSKWFWFRIAVSTFFGLLTVALPLLWWRSYSTADTLVIGFVPGRCTVVDSMFGKIYAGNYDGTVRFKVSSKSMVGVRFFESGTSQLVISHWWLALLSLSVSALSFSPIRFSLRTLLVVTTLIALALGWCAWGASRDFPVGSPEWWNEHRWEAVWYPRKGYRVKGVEGYFNAQGERIPDKSP